MKLDVLVNCVKPLALTPAHPLVSNICINSDLSGEYTTCILYLKFYTDSESDLDHTI